MAVKIKLKRMGKIREPYFRIVVADARTKRDGRAIEEIGKYHPKADPSLIEVNSERAQHWLSVGAQPTDPVRKLLEVTGDWQRFKGLPGAEGTYKPPAPRSDKKEVFAAALAETLQEGGATTKGKGRAGAKAGDGDAKVGDGKARAKTERPARPVKAETAKPEGAKAETAKSESAKAGSGKAEAKAEGESAAAAKSAGAKSADAKSAGAKSADAKSDDAKSDDTKSGEPKAAEAKAAEAKSSAAKPSAAKSASSKAAAKAEEPAPEEQDGSAADGDTAAAAAEPGSGD